MSDAVRRAARTSGARAGRRPARAAPIDRGAGPWQAYRVELRKLASQWIPRAVAALCLLGPLVFIATIRTQTTLPADTIYGRWLKTSGAALPFFLLGPGAMGGFFLLISLIAGDVFASEDRYGTWQTVLTRSCRRVDLFGGKVFAAATVSVGAVVLLVIGGTAAGAAFVGLHPLVNLSGESMSAGHALLLAVASWGSVLLPAVAVASLAMLFSVATRSSVLGVILPVVVGLLMVLLGVLGFRTLVLTTAFEAWHGLVTSPAHLEPLLQESLVSIAYIAVCIGAAWLLFRGRDVAGAGPVGRRPIQAARVRVGAVGFAALVLLTVASYRPSAITSARLQAAVPVTFSHLAQVRQSLTGRPVYIRGRAITPALISTVTTQCRRGGNPEPARGPAEDWICIMTSGTGSNALLFGYELNVHSNGCYTAQGSSAIFGHPLIYDTRYDQVVNPLYEFDACLGLP